MLMKPFEIEITRGPQTESRHFVHGVIYGQKGHVLEVYGNSQLPVFPRSSLKPIQALPLIQTGAADHFNITDAELALACASHRGEPMHIEPIRAWLARIGHQEADLECGTHPPVHQESLFHLLRSHNLPSPVHNNCSGKHTGMLMTAKHLGESHKNYVSLSHPVQQRILKEVETFCEFTFGNESLGVDGCSIPAPCLPLENLAKGFAEWIAPQRADELTAKACTRIYKAFVDHPLLTAGTGHYCSEVMIETKGRALVKGGAEGVIVAAIPELQMGIALKTLDGNTRASDHCMSVILERLGLLSSSSLLLNPHIQNWNQIETGEIRLK
ncbi:MAG: hypothetical protein RJB66_695 [Pseudomonadota bacterium]|jgi:L-asparaginase II